MNIAAGERVDPSLTIIKDATCPLCSCVCDDIDLSIKDSHIIEAKQACSLGDAWFRNCDTGNRPSCLIEGQVASVAEGIERTARILTEAQYPIIYGLSDTTCEAQRIAVGIGDWIGGTVDTPTSVYHGPSGVTFQGVGEVTCSLGEIANRGDFILFWGSNPAESQPRHFAKYSLMPKGMFLPNGRQDRTAVLVDVRETETAKSMDLFYQIKPGCDFEALWILRALAKGIDLDPQQTLDDTGIELARWQELMDRMKAAKFGVILFGMGLTMTRGKYINAEAVLALVRDLNAFTRFVARPMRGRGNVTGADNVLSWQTGYPFGVNLSRGYPRFNPGEYTTAEMLARGEADAAMIIATDPGTHFSQASRKWLNEIPYITLDPQETPITRAATVTFTTATYGIHVSGTVYRMDDVPIPLRPALKSSHSSDVEVLTAIERRIKELKAATT